MLYIQQHVSLAITHDSIYGDISFVPRILPIKPIRARIHMVLVCEVLARAMCLIIVFSHSCRTRGRPWRMLLI